MPLRKKLNPASFGGEGAEAPMRKTLNFLFHLLPRLDDTTILSKDFQWHSFVKCLLIYLGNGDLIEPTVPQSHYPNYHLSEGQGESSQYLFMASARADDIIYVNHSSSLRLNLIQEEMTANTFQECYDTCTFLAIYGNEFNS